MKRTWMTGSLTVVCAATAFVALSHGLQAQSTATPTAPTGRFAVIDIVKVFNEYERQREFVAQLKDAQTNLQTEDKKRRDDLDRMQADLAKVAPGDPTHKTRVRELQAKSIDYKNWADIKQAAINREIGVWSAEFYRDIVIATEGVAMQLGYDAVIYKDEFQMPENADPNAVREQIRNRKVIYANPAIEVTQQVLDKLNNEYRAKPKVGMLDVGP